MSEFDNQPGIGFGTGAVDLRHMKTKCKFCGEDIYFFKGKPQNLDYTEHRCLSRNNNQTHSRTIVDSDAALRGYATAAMQAVVTGLVMKGGKEAIHAMDSRLLAEAAWGIAVAMKDAADSYQPSTGSQS